MDEKNIQASSRVAALIAGYLLNQLSAKEVQELEGWVNASAVNNAIFTRVLNEENLEQQGQLIKSIDVEADMAIAKANLDFEPGLKKIKLWPRIAGVAAAVAAIAFGIWFFTAPHNPERSLPSGATAKDLGDIAPGGNRATLTSNGKSINLSNAKTGIAINAAAVTYNDGTKLDPSALRMTEGDSRALAVSTPRGGTYSITLSDGTKVWLNADSKLEFYSNYSNKLQRIVKLSGEAYFEVATAYTSLQGRRTKQAFIVQTATQTIEVLGTHFNVNTFGDEHPGTVTSLLEGSVKASNENGETILKPGDRGVSSIKGILLLMGNAKDDIAWKNGKFRFDDSSLIEVMNQLARWYDVEVQYPEGIPELHFTGDMNRNVKLSETLALLNYTKLKFKIEGRRIIVTK
uniref:FecR family protein n=1 Tax=Pedobacter schmidteae TaxID=2201271 RepID=UPI000EB018D0|nr:FecR family protein [Pedobacter schmidteae]